MNATVISKDVINNIAECLSRSSFGSGDMIAEILADPDFQMPCENGIWDISEVNWDGVYYYDYRHRRDSYLGSPTWRERRGFSINIEKDTIEFVLGCGVHGASCIFDKKTGELIEVIPDGSPSNEFWGDGDCPNLTRRARREFLRMTTPVHSHA